MMDNNHRDPQAHADKAREIWEQMDKQEQIGVRFGIPAKKIDAATAEGYSPRQLVVAVVASATTA